MMNCQTKEALEASIAAGFQELEAQKLRAIEEMRRQKQAAADDLAKIWQRVLRSVYVTLPEWLHPFVTYRLTQHKISDGGYDLFIRPACLDIPQSMSPILVFSDFRREDAEHQVFFYPVRYAILKDEEAASVVKPTAFTDWTEYDILNQCTPDLNIALAQARQSFEERDRLIEELCERKAQQAQAQVQAPKPEKTPLEQMQAQMYLLDIGNEHSLQAAMHPLTYALTLAVASIATSLDRLAQASVTFNGEQVINTFDMSRPF